MTRSTCYRSPSRSASTPTPRTTLRARATSRASPRARAAGGWASSSSLPRWSPTSATTRRRHALASGQRPGNGLGVQGVGQLRVAWPKPKPNLDSNQTVSAEKLCSFFLESQLGFPASGSRPPPCLAPGAPCSAVPSARLGRYLCFYSEAAGQVATPLPLPLSLPLPVPLPLPSCRGSSSSTPRASSHSSCSSRSICSSSSSHSS